MIRIDGGNITGSQFATYPTIVNIGNGNITVNGGNIISHLSNVIYNNSNGTIQISSGNITGNASNKPTIWNKTNGLVIITGGTVTSKGQLYII